MVTLASSSHEWSPHSPKSTWNPKNKSGIIAHYYGLWLQRPDLSVCFISFSNALASCEISLGLCDLQEALGPLSRPQNTCLPTGRRPRNVLGSLAVCVCVCVCVVSLTLGCRCQDEEELYELTRHQIVLCFHLCPGVCVSVVSPDFWKNNAGYL